MSSETKLLKLKEKVKILKQLDKKFYPWLDSILKVFYREPNNPYYEEDFKILMNCIQNLTEKYIFENNSPSKEWQAIGLSTLFIVYKAFSVDEIKESKDLRISHLVKVCSDCSREQIANLEMQILKMNNYIVCEHILKISTPKQRLKKSARRVITRSYRKKSK